MAYNTVPPCEPEDNICKFSNIDESDHDLFAFQFIYETMPQRFTQKRQPMAFSCHLVTDGTACLETDYGKFPLTAGDIFFLFPSESYTFTDCHVLKYLYIAFVGSRPSDLLESMGITRMQPVRHGYTELMDTWVHGLTRCTSANLSCLAKGLLYYTFAFLPWADGKTEEERDDTIILQIKATIDRCYANPDLSLDDLCTSYQYNSKYISLRFRESVGVGFKDYLESCRIRHACVLLCETDCSIQEIAVSVGYRDPLYFSKVFKKVLALPPTDYRLQHGADTTNTRKVLTT